MLDTEWKAKVDGIVPGTPLDAERFFRRDILEPATPGHVRDFIRRYRLNGP